MSNSNDNNSVSGILSEKMGVLSIAKKVKFSECIKIHLVDCDNSDRIDKHYRDKNFQRMRDEFHGKNTGDGLSRVLH